MPLTGTGIRIGSATRFGQDIRYPRAMASDVTTLFLFDANEGLSLNPDTGEATQIGSVTNFDVGENKVRSATYHNNQVLVFGRENEKIQVYNTSTGVLTDWHTSLINYADSTITGRPDLWGIASLNGVLYGVDRQTDALYIISSLGVLTRVGTATQFGISAGRVQGFTAYRGKLIGADTSLDKIFEINPTTGVATIIAATNSLPDGSPEALAEHNGNLYMAGSAADALFRLYDVLWDETIGDLEVDESSSQTWSLSDISQDAASFSLVPGQSPAPPSWLSVSGTDLVATNASSVTADENYDVDVRATRDGVNIDETLRIVIRNTDVPLMPPGTPTNLRVVSATTSEINIAWGRPTNNGGAAIEDYLIDVDGTASLTGSTATTARITRLSASQTVSITVAAVNPEGTGTASGVLEATTDAEFTISTDETDIREQKAFDIKIAATGDVANLTLAKISVTGASADNLTPNDPDDYTLRVTADAGAGNIVVSIAEDAVSPGNAPASKTFTRKAFPTVTATATESNLRPGGQTPITILWSEIVTGLSDTEVSVDIGSLSNFQGEDDTYTALLTAPTTPPSGEITLSIAANAVDQGNVAYSVKIRYAPPSPPTWQPSSALQSAVDALETTRINIANLVDRANKIEAVGGLQEWLDFDGTDLIVSEAPILRKDTVFRVTLKASNDDGSRKAVYILTANASKLAMLQSTLFFKPSITYDSDRVTVHGTTRIVREMTDNNYETYSSENDVAINTADADGNHPTTIHFIALKTKKVDAFSFEPTGGTGVGFRDRPMPTRFVATGGEDIPTLVNGFQHELYPLPEPVTATSVRMQFHGTDIEIYAVMLLELIVEIPDGDFLDILPDKVDRTGEIIDFPDGGVDRGDVIGAERWKWETQYVLEVLPEGTAFETVPKVRKFISDHPHIVHAEEPARHPGRIYPAEMVSLEISEEYQSKRGYRTAGSIVPFRVHER